VLRGQGVRKKLKQGARVGCPPRRVLAMRTFFFSLFFLLLVPGALSAQVDQGAQTRPTHSSMLISAALPFEAGHPVHEWLGTCSPDGEHVAISTFLRFACTGGQPSWPTHESHIACEGGPAWVPNHAVAQFDGTTYGAAFCYGQVPTSVEYSVFLPAVIKSTPTRD